MAANAESSRRNLYSVSSESTGQAMDLGEGTSRRISSSLDRSRQSSEFHPKDSTIHDIWKVTYLSNFCYQFLCLTFKVIPRVRVK